MVLGVTLTDNLASEFSLGVEHGKPTYFTTRQMTLSTLVAVTGKDVYLAAVVNLKVISRRICPIIIFNSGADNRESIDGILLICASPRQ